MTPHDSHFKLLIRVLFREFLEAFVPNIARDLKPRSIQFLDKEAVRTAGARLKRRIADVVARVELRGGAGFVLVHIEHQAQRQAEIRRRLFFYAVALMEQYGLPVYPILLTSYDRPTDAEPNHYTVQVRDLQVIDFRFRVVQLNRLDWRKF